MTAKRGALSLALGLLGLALGVYGLCPRPSLYGDTGFSTALQDRNGVLLRLGLADDQRYRLKVALDDIAPSAVKATLLYEDQHFYSHPGVNPAALMRAAWSTYVHGRRVMGGSTISMQLARLRFSLRTRSVAGKVVQVLRAVQLERHYSKHELLEAYLNLAPYGGNLEGIGTAALVYFDKPASQLSLPEALALAVIPQNPAQRHPAKPGGYRAMVGARQRLAERWHDTFGLTAEGRAQLELPLAVRAPGELPFLAEHFSTALLAGNDAGVLVTTLALPEQRILEAHITSHTERNRAVGIDNASALLIDHRSMEVLAAVGSADFFGAGILGQVDGTRAKRSPGSTLKPFVYGVAIDQGLIHPMTLLVDAPRRFAAYTPENFDRGFMGPVFARDALIYSRNVPAIEVLSRVGISRFHEFLSAGGVANLNSAEHYGLAMVLGGLELSMEELVRLYAMLANGGTLRELVKLRRASAAGSGVRLMSREASFLVLDMLRSNPRPDGLVVPHHADRPSVAWKTGTSYAFRDAWSVGVIGPYVLAVWVGNFDGSSNPAFVGREAAAPLFFAIADTLAKSIEGPVHALYPPPELNLRKVAVCASTGDLPGKTLPAHHGLVVCARGVTHQSLERAPGRAHLQRHRQARVRTASGHHPHGGLRVLAHEYRAAVSPGGCGRAAAAALGAGVQPG